MPASQLERVARSWRRVTTAQEADGHERRGLVIRWDDDGMLVVSGRLTPEEGELLLSALEAVDESSAEDSSTGGDDGFVFRAPSGNRIAGAAASQRAD